MKTSALPLRLALLAAAATALAWFGWLMLRQPAAASVEDVLVPCASLRQGCTVGDLRIATLSTPSANRPFVVDIVAPSQPVLLFEMADMAMGVARFTPTRRADGHWQVQVGLPVCISGSSAWLMTIEVGGQRYQVPFTATARGDAPAS